MHLLCENLVDIIQNHLPTDERASESHAGRRVRVGFITYDTKVHFYNIKVSVYLIFYFSLRNQACDGEINAIFDFFFWLAAIGLPWSIANDDCRRHGGYVCSTRRRIPVRSDRVAGCYRFVNAADTKHVR